MQWRAGGGGLGARLKKIGFRPTKGVNMRVADVMTRSVFIVNPDETIQEAATAMAGIDDAQRMSGKLDLNANARAGEAAQIMATMLATAAR